MRQGDGSPLWRVQTGSNEGAMVLKRPRRPSSSGNESDDEAPPLRRQRVDDGPSLVGATQSLKSHLETLPLELHSPIVARLFVSHDVVGTLRNLGRLSAAGSSTKKGVDFYLGPTNLKWLNEHLKDLTKILDHFAIDYNATCGVVAERQAHLRAEAAQLPLKSAEDRHSSVMKILNYKRLDFDHEGVRNVIHNLHFVDPHIRPKVVQHMRDHLEDGLTDDLVSDFVGAADALSGNERNYILQASIKISDEEARRKALGGWAGKLRLLDDFQQTQILNSLTACDADGKALAGFAEHAEGLSPANRSLLVETIVSLPNNDACRSLALSHLACQARISDADRSKVATSIFADLEQFDTEFSDLEDVPWHARPDFCKLEALRNLAESSLSQKEGDRGTLTIQDRLKSLEPVGNRGADSVRAQFIDRLPSDERAEFTQKILRKAVMPEGVILGLAARLDKLDKNERKLYFSHLFDLEGHSEAGKRAVAFIIGNKLDTSNKQERSFLIARQAEILRDYEDPSYAGQALADIAKNARYLDISDVKTAVIAADTVVRKHLADLPLNPEADKSIRACAGHAARCVSNWVNEVLSSPLSAQVRATSREPRDTRQRNSSAVR